MIHYISGNLFHSPAQVLVNTVNTVGVMGKGIALEFKQIYPEMFERYRDLCERGEFGIGQLWLYKSPNKWVLNFPTKKHWRHPSKPEYVEAGLRKFQQVYADWGIHSIAFPALGCGNGELDFDAEVRPLMEKILGKLPIDIFIYPDQDDPFLPEHLEPAKFREWLRSQPEALPFSEVWDDIQELLAEQEMFWTIKNNNPFTARLTTDLDGIEVIASGHSYFVSKDTLFSFWQQLRSYGFSSRKIAPGISREASYVMAILARLPYVKTVQMALNYDSLRAPAIGLQYVPGFKPSTPGRTPTQRSLGL